MRQVEWRTRMKSPETLSCRFTLMEAKYRAIRLVTSNFFLSRVFHGYLKNVQSNGTISYILSNFFFAESCLSTIIHDNIRAANSVKLCEKLFKYLNSTFYLKTFRRWTEKSLLGKFLQPRRLNFWSWKLSEQTVFSRLAMKESFSTRKLLNVPLIISVNWLNTERKDTICWYYEHASTHSTNFKRRLTNGERWKVNKAAGGPPLLFNDHFSTLGNVRGAYLIEIPLKNPDVEEKRKRNFKKGRRLFILWRDTKEVHDCVQRTYRFSTPSMIRAWKTYVNGRLFHVRHFSSLEKVFARRITLQSQDDRVISKNILWYLIL